MHPYVVKLSTGIASLAVVASSAIVGDYRAVDHSHLDVAASVDVAPVFTMKLPPGVAPERVSVAIEPTSDAEAKMEVGDTYPELWMPDRSTRIVGRNLQLIAAPADVPADRIDSEGVVTFVVTAVSDAGEVWSTRESVQLVTDDSGNLAWIDAMSPSARKVAAVRPSSQRNAYAYTVLSEHDVPRDQVPTKQLTYVGKAHQDGIANAASAHSRISAGHRSMTASAPSAPAAKLIKKQNWWVTVGTTYPVGRSTATLEFRGYKGHELGVATSVSGKFGSFTATSLKKTSDGWGFKTPLVQGMRSYQIEVEYGLYEVPYGCINMMGAVVCNWKFEWRPRVQTGGTKTPSLSSRPSWRTAGNCTGAQAPGDWWREASGHKAYKYDAAVKSKTTIGIELGISRQYSTTEGNSAKHHYFLRTGVPKIMCGNDGYPTRSGKQVEYKK